MELLLIIAQQIVLHLPLMLGAYVVIALMKVPDLSIESSYVCGAIVGAQLVLALPHMPLGILLPLVIIGSCLGGALVGTISSSITQYIGCAHLLSSIITMGLFHGINQMLLGSYVSLSNVHNPLTLYSVADHFPELTMLTLLGMLVVICMYYFYHTQLGYACAVYGNNPEFFSHYGISGRYVFISGIVLGNALAGLSGYLFAQSNGFVELNMGIGKPLLCITALIMGKAVCQTSRPVSILIPLAGTALYFLLQQLLLKVGFNLKYFTMLQAGIVLAIVAVTTRRTRSVDHLGV